MAPGTPLPPLINLVAAEVENSQGFWQSGEPEKGHCIPKSPLQKQPTVPIELGGLDGGHGVTDLSHMSHNDSTCCSVPVMDEPRTPPHSQTAGRRGPSLQPSGLPSGHPESP